jgi:CHAT domain-containing protein/tetratricopeptide (TPR) repeat protein
VIPSKLKLASFTYRPWSLVFAVGCTLFLTGCSFWQLSADQDLRSKPPVTNTPTQITSYLAGELSPKIDLSGERIIYVSDEGGNRDIWARQLKGGVPVRLTDHTADDFDPDVSRLNGRIAFVSYRFDAKGDIFVINSDGSNAVILTDRFSSDGQPAWFPDGKKIAYSRSKGLDAESIFIVDVNSKKSRRLVKRPGFNPAISPDGRFLLFTTLVRIQDEDRSCLWLHRIADGHERPLHGCQRPEGFGAWAADGEKLWIVFSRFQDDTNFDGKISLDDSPGLWKIELSDWTQEDPNVGMLIPLTSGATADITPSFFDGTVYYASKVDRDLDIYSIPLFGSGGEVQSYTQARKLAGKAENVFDSLYHFRRCAARHYGLPDGDYCALSEADALFDSGRLEQAALSYAAIIARTTMPNIRSRALLGQIYTSMDSQLPKKMSPSLQAEKMPDAQILLDKLGKIEVEQEAKNLLSADIYRRVGQWEKSIQLIDSSLRGNIEDTRLLTKYYLLKGDVLAVLGDLDSALRGYIKVLNTAGVARSEKMLATKRTIDIVTKKSDLDLDIEDPVEKLEKIIAQWSELSVLPAMARLKIAKLQQKVGKQEIAKRGFRMIEEEYHGEPEIVAQALYSLSKNAEKSGDLSQALDDANEMLQRFSDNPQITRKAKRRIGTLARIHAKDLEQQGELGMAIKVYRQLIKQEPDNIIAHRKYIELLSASGRVRQAVTEYKSRQQADPENDLSLYLYGLSLTYLDPPSWFDDSIDIIEQALLINPQLPYAHQTLGWIHEQLARYNDEQEKLHQAADSYQSALSLLDKRLYPRQAADLLLNLGNVHYALKNYGEAYGYYKRREESKIGIISPIRKMVFYEQYGRSAFMSKQLQDAISAYKIASQLARRQGMTARLPWLVGSLGAAYQLAEKYNQAVETHQLACDLYEKEKRIDKYTSCKRNVAYSLYMQGNQKASLKAFIETQEYLKKYGSSGSGVGAGTSVGLGKIASRAAYGFDQAGELIFLTTFQARIFEQAGDLKKAREKLEEKVAMIEQQVAQKGYEDMTIDLTYACNHLGSIYVQSGEYKLGAKYFKKSAELADKAGSYQGVIVNLLNRLDLSLIGHAGLKSHEILSELTLLQERIESGETEIENELQVRLYNAIGVARVDLVDQTANPLTGFQGTNVERVKKVLSSLDSNIQQLSQAKKEFVKAGKMTEELESIGRKSWRQYIDYNISEIEERLRKPDKKKGAKLEDQQVFSLDWRTTRNVSDEDRVEALLRLPPNIAGTQKDLLAIRDREYLFSRLISTALATSDKMKAFEWSEKLLARRRIDAINFEDFTYLSDHDQKNDPGSQGENPSIFLKTVYSTTGAGVDKIKDNLEKNEGLLQVIVLPKQLVAFLVTNSDLKVYRSTDNVAQLVKELKGKDLLLAQNARSKLSAMLLAPIEKELEKLEQLTVVADDIGINFGMLELKNQELIMTLDVGHVYSAADWLVLRDSRNLNINQVTWIGQKPTQNLVKILEKYFGLVDYIDIQQAAVDRRLNSGVVVLDSVVAPNFHQPVRSVLSPDKQLGVFGGVNWGQLNGRFVDSGLWVFGVPGIKRAEKQEALSAWLGLGLETAMLAANVPTSVVFIHDSESKKFQQRLEDLAHKMNTNSPGRAFSLVLRNLLSENKWQDFIEFQLRGDMGMNPEKRKNFANQNLVNEFKKGQKAEKRTEWQSALVSWLAVRRYAVYMNADAFLSKIDRRIVICADKLKKYDLAIEYQMRVLDRAQKAKDQLAIATAHMFLGILNSKIGHHIRAVDELRKAATIFDVLGKGAEAAAAVTTLARALDQAAEYKEAVSAFKDALKRYQDLDNQSQVIHMMRSLGTQYRKRLNMIGSAREWYQKALVQADKLEDLNARESTTAEVLLDLCRAERTAGDYDKSLKLARRAAETYEKRNDFGGQGSAWLDQAQALWYFGEYQRAFVAQKKALEFAQKANDVKLGIFSKSIGGLIAMSMGDLKKAADLLTQALMAAREAGLRDEEAVQLNNLGKMFREKGDYQEALKHFEMALRIDSQLKSVAGKAYDLRHIGLVKKMLGRLDEAADNLEEALNLSRTVHDRFNEVEVLLGLAKLGLVRKNMEQAMDYANQAHQNALELGLKDTVWRALRILGRIVLEQGRLGEAEAYFQQAIEVMERMRSGFNVETLGKDMSASKYDLYQDMILLLLERGKVKEAFSYSERSRSRGFLDLLGNRDLALGSQFAQEKLSKIRLLKESIVSLGEELRASSEEEKNKVEKILVQKNNQYQELITQLQQQKSGLIDFVEVKPSKLPEIRASLPSDVALLSYYVTKEKTIIWVVKKEGLRVKIVDITRDDLKKKITNVLKLIRNFSPLDPELEDLYRLLVAPVESEIKKQQIVGILPHSVLHYLPFAALRTKNGYWSDRVNIFSCPSASVMMQLLFRQQENMGPAGGLLAVGNPDIGEPGLQLPFAEREALAISYEQAGGSVLLRKAATEEEFKKQAGANDYIHLASHGMFDAMSPLKSKLKLAPGEDEDGDLTVLEVFSIPLSARLVTLSACRTGLSKIQSGDEVVGFNRAFLSAGAESILSSLWDVSDLATAILMKRFYRNMKTNNPLTAIRKARQLVRKYYKHPAYWAGFVYVGTWL